MDRFSIDLDLSSRTAKRGGRVVKLSPKECKLLSYLLEHKNTVVDRKKLLKYIWQYAPDVETRVVDVYMGYLRKKIDEGFNNKTIFSIRGSGYILKV